MFIVNVLTNRFIKMSFKSFVCIFKKLVNIRGDMNHVFKKKIPPPHNLLNKFIGEIKHI